jgi:argininosuccinate synthase
VATAALAPELEVVAPVRDWDMGRPQEIEYAREHGIEVPVTAESPYSVDANLWGRSIECGPLEDPWREPPDEVFAWTADPASSPAAGTQVTIGFRRGLPVSLDGETLRGDILVSRLNQLAGRHGVGRIDHVENRLVGIKSREIYEAPAAVTLHAAHAALETLTLGRDVLQLKRRLSDDWGRLVYDGLWYGHLRASLAGFVTATQEPVSGEVRLRLCQGAATVVGRRAPGSLYQQDLATYDRKQDVFDHSAARGFIELFGLPLRTQARIQGALEDSAPLPLERRVRRAP